MTKYSSIYDTQNKRKIRGEVCIYRVPDKLRQVKEDAYRPSVVSIGPLHKKDRNLGAMEEFKLSYMLSLLHQQSTAAEDAEVAEEYHTQPATKCLEECMDVIYSLDEVVRQCYTEKINYKEDELAEIVLLDGCFILELFLRCDRNLKYMKQDDCNFDPVLRSAWTIAGLQHDLALLENQIPFFVLELLYNTIKPHITRCKLPQSVGSLALNFFHPVSRKEIKEEPAGAKHLLDLLHKFYFHPNGQLPFKLEIDSDNEQHSALQRVTSRLLGKIKGENQTPPCLPSHHQRDQASKGKWEFNYCASELLESGIEFKVGPSTQQYLLDIKFEDGVIIIPQLRIHETTNSLLKNQIAYEQCCLRSTHRVTSYVFLLKSLIRTSGDSKLLQARNIIEHNNLIRDKEFLSQFESVLDQVVMKDNFCYAALLHQVNKYCNAQSSWKLRLVVGREEGNPAEMIDSDEEIQKEVRGRAKWIAEIEERLGGVNEAEDSCIYKVPSKLRRVKQDAYNPRVVSIGPFHRGDPELVAGMRKHKWRYMLSFLQQTDDPYESRSCLKNCTEAIYNLDMKVRQCYAENVEYDKNNLAQIMLLDGCFILELFLRYYAKNAGEKSKPDPVFKSSWMVTALQHDLALLENQIPFFILELLYEVVRPSVASRKPPHSVAGLALMFFQPLSRKSIPKEDQDKLGTDFKHLLDLLHKFYFLPVPHDHEKNEKKNADFFIPSGTC
ncbi:Hypothetical predicted protein [Prunus dulcis]|uniref:Uncharacterized protein n=1 Tax=Prunus dulcis TaxID=3755 RepID=A0A5E4EGW2_PRUDU|nr:Hypothetical predicted protein [Prunus dulcis]